MTSFEIKQVYLHPYPEKGMMLVNVVVEYDGVTKKNEKWYVPCIEVE